MISLASGVLPRNRKLATKVWHEMNEQISNYIRGKVMEILIVGSVSYVTFALLDLRYSVLLAVAVGLSVLIPYIGAAAVTVPVAIVGLFQWGFTPEFYWLLLAYGIIQALDGNVLVPILFSEAVNLHPVAIIVAVLVFGGLWGFWGCFLPFLWPLSSKQYGMHCPVTMKKMLIATQVNDSFHIFTRKSSNAYAFELFYCVEGIYFLKECFTKH